MEQAHSNPWLRTRRIARHFAATRGPEVLVLQASPILGGIVGGFRPEGWDITRMTCLVFGSLALTAHIFILNDWAGHRDDIRDPRRTARVFSRMDIARILVMRIALLLLFLALIAFAALGPQIFLIGTAIAVLSFAYSCTPNFGKRTPVLGSLNHLLGGALHFLLGYSVFHAPDTSGIALSLFFGLVFTGGHLNQEVRDHAGDALNGIRTNAVVFGRRPTFLASAIVFTAAYVVLAGIAAHRSLPALLICCIAAWMLHIAFTLRALRRGLGFETAGWMQRRYRILFACIGLILLFHFMHHTAAKAGSAAVPPKTTSPST